MANKKDSSTVPAVITITNTDPGVIDKELTSVIDVTDDEGNTTQEVNVVYLTEPMEQQVQLYRVNFWVPIAPEDSLKIVAQTSEEVAYYMAMNSERLTVAVEGAESTEEAAG